MYPPYIIQGKIRVDKRVRDYHIILMWQCSITPVSVSPHIFCISCCTFILHNPLYYLQYYIKGRFYATATLINYKYHVQSRTSQYFVTNSSGTAAIPWKFRAIFILVTSTHSPTTSSSSSRSGSHLRMSCLSS